MNPVFWIIFGAIAGWIAGRLYGDDRPEGCVTNIVLGIGGALLGGAIYTLITGRDFTTGFNLPEPDRRNSRRAAADFRAAAPRPEPVQKPVRVVLLCYTPIRFPAALCRIRWRILCPSIGQSLNPATRGRLVGNRPDA